MTRYVYGKVFNCRCYASPSEKYTAIESEDKSLIDYKTCPNCDAKLRYEYKAPSRDQLNVCEVPE